MARHMLLAAALVALLLVCSSPASEARSASRRLNSPYPSSGSSPDTSSPVSGSPDTSSPDTGSPDTSSPYSGSSPDTSSPTPDISSPTPDTTTPSPDISSPTPDTTTPSPDTTPDVTTPSPDTTPDTSTPSPVTLPPVTSSPTGGYGGYGSHAGFGTPKFWLGNPARLPKILSLVSSIAKLFGPRILNLLGNRSMMGALKDQSPEAFPSLAREGATSLINAYAYKDFPLSSMEVVAQFNNALNSAELAREQALKFQRLNEAL